MIENYKEMATISPYKSGSVLLAENGTYWYSCGPWRIQNFPNSIPSILAYAPENEKFIKHNNQKTLSKGEQTLLKIFGRPFQEYTDSYIVHMQGMIESFTLGRVAFLPKERIIEVNDPKDFTKHFISNSPRQGRVLLELIDLLQIPLKNIGISGSSLVLMKPVERHEIDLCVYGKTESRRIFTLLEEYRKREIVRDRPNPELHLPFSYNGVLFDPQFAEGEYERGHLDGVNIRFIKKLSDIQVSIYNTVDAIFYPPIYQTTEGRRLISFRPGHRGLFREGQTVQFQSISLIELSYPNMEKETVFAVLEDEWGTIIRK